MHENQFFQTSDFPLAISLSCMGFALEAVDKTNKQGRSSFVYQHSSALDEVVRQFWKNELRIEPNAFFQATKFLKQNLYRD